MKNKYRILKILVTVIIFGCLLYFSLKRFNEKPINDVAIHFLTNSNQDKVYFLDEKQIKDFVLSQIPTNTIQYLDIALLEKKINSFPSVDSANVYVSLNGNVHVEVMQRVPVFRLSRGEDTFYVDTNGEEFPVSKHYTHNVLLVSGDVKREEYPRVIELVSKLRSDDFSNRYFIGVIKDKGGYYMLTHDGHFKVELGELQNIGFKIDSFKIFMEKYLSGQPSDKYSKISLRFSNQIVTTLRKGEVVHDESK